MLTASTSPPARSLPAAWQHRSSTRIWVEGPGRARLHSSLRLLFLLTRHEFRARYRAQALGVVWSLLHPVVMMGILSLIFSRVFVNQTPHFAIFMLIGLIVWQFVGQAANSATMAFVTHAEIVKRTIFPRPLLPIAVVLSYGINFLVESMVLVGFIPFYPESFTLSWSLLLLPLVLVLLAILLSGIGLMASALNVIYRDVAYLVSTGLLLLYWLTPVIYPIEVIPEPYQAILKCNPITGILGALRGIIIEGRPPSLLGWAGMVVPTGLVVLGGWLVFRHYERMVLDHV